MEFELSPQISQSTTITTIHYSSLYDKKGDKSCVQMSIHQFRPSQTGPAIPGMQSTLPCIPLVRPCIPLVRRNYTQIASSPELLDCETNC